RVAGAPVPARVGYVVVLRPMPVAAEEGAPPEDGRPEDAPADVPGEGAPAAAEATADDAAAEDVDDGEDEPALRATGRAEAPVAERPPAAVSDIEFEIGELRRVPRTSAQGMLNLVPGVLLTQHATEGHALGMFLRGFDAGEGEDLEVLVDGMPINEVSNAHGHGYVDTLMAIPQVVDRLHVVQGPFDPAQGDFATAGTAEYVLGLDEPGLHLSLGYGRFGEVRLSGAWRPASASEGTFAAIAYNQGDGFGPNRAFRNGSALGRYAGGSETLRYSLLAFAASGSWSSAGVLRLDDVERDRVEECPPGRDSQFFCFYDPNQGGSTSQLGFVGRLEHRNPNERFELTTFARARSLRITENFTGFSEDPRNDGLEQRGDNLDQRYDATTVGARGRYRVSRAWLGFPQRFEAGVHLRYDDADTRADRRREDTIPYTTEFDRRVREAVAAAYVRGDLRFTEWLSLLGGVRLDYFGFNVEDRNFPTTDSDGARLSRQSSSASGTAVSPRATLRARIAEDLHVVVAAGLGARSSDAAGLSDDELAPFARVTALEAGAVYRRVPDEEESPWFGEVRASAFTTRVSQDLVFNAADGRNSVLGPSARSGVLMQGRLRYGTYVDVLGSLTYTRSHLQPDGANTFALFDGPRLPFIPGWLGRLDATGSLPVVVRAQTITLSAALGVQYVGERPLPLGQVAEPFSLVDVALGARWRFIEVGVALRNLFDARYRSDELNYPSNFRDPELPPSMRPSRHFSAGAPRTYLLTLTLHLDPREGRTGSAAGE
ncbi:MAG: TonB-dependent receptor, partial [Myxococcota bacterium]